jgi:hypothetical protein
MRKSLEKILTTLQKKNPAFNDVDSLELTFLFRAPIKTAMCDWVYGIKVHTKTPEVNQTEISSLISQTIINSMARVSNDLLCATDINFESVY